MQIKLLRVLQEKCITPIGHHTEIPVDFRLVCATHKNLAHEVEQGRFREDLFYRLNVIKLELPPLRNRKEDIPLLLMEWLKNSKIGMEVPEIMAELVPIC